MRPTIMQVPVAATMPYSLRAVAYKTLGVTTLTELYKTMPPASNPTQFAEYVLERLAIHTQLEGDLAQLPKEGPAILVGNLPFGVLEGLIILAHILPLRPDCKIMANLHLAGLPEIAERFIPIDPYCKGKRRQRNIIGLREAHAHLAKGGMLALFPAETVSASQKSQGANDPVWTSVAVRLAQKYQATIFPFYFGGKSSLSFSRRRPKIHSVLLPRELLHKRGASITATLGRPISQDTLKALGTDKAMTAYTRMRCYALKPVPETIIETRPPMQPVGTRSAEHEIIQELERIAPHTLLLDEGEYQLHVVKAHEAPLLLKELGRVREITFREVGEGSGHPWDLDQYDNYYHHLLLWNVKDRQLTGAYRLGLVPEIIAAYGRKGLYTESLFRFSPLFFSLYGQSIELGRAVVHPDYQRDYAPLYLLWKGIGQFVLQHPTLRYLFGSVSVSLTYQPATLQLLMDYFTRSHGSPQLFSLLQGRCRMRPALGKQHRSLPMRDMSYNAVNALVKDFEGGRGIPVLFKHYFRLAGSIGGFHADKAFNTLDAFLVVDLLKTPTSMLDRYMGATQAEQYRAGLRAKE